MHIVFSAIFLFIRCVFPSSSKWILDWIKLVWRVSKYQFSYWSSHGSMVVLIDTHSGLISVEIEISHWWRQEGQLAGVAEVLQKSQSTISVGMPKPFNGAVHDVKSIFFTSHIWQSASGLILALNIEVWLTVRHSLELVLVTWLYSCCCSSVVVHWQGSIWRRVSLFFL